MHDDKYETSRLLGADYSYHESLRGKVFSTRYQIAFMGFLGYLLLFGMRASISVALVAMVTEHETKPSSQNENCPMDENDTDSSNDEVWTGDFDWTTTEQAYLLASFFYGYLITQIPGGYFSSKIGGKHLYGIGLLVRAILFMLNPPVAFLGVYALIALRIIEGIIEAVTMPAFHQITGRWAPKFERSIFSGLAISGFAVGTMLSQLIAGYLSSFDFLHGWPLVFYFFGFLSVVWFVFWMYIAHNSPDKHPRISESEKEFINKFTKVDDNKKYKIPWKAIGKSLPFYGIIAGHIAQNTICYGIMNSLPLYLSNVLNFDIESDGVFSALPWLFCFIGVIIASQLTDFIRSQKYVTTTCIRKTNQIIGSVIPAIFLVSAGYAGCNAGLAISFICFGMFFFAFAYSGCFCNHLDIAPYFAGTLFGITNTFAALPGMILLTLYSTGI